MSLPRLPGVMVRIVPDLGTVAPPYFAKFPCIIGTGDVERVRKQNVQIIRAASGFTDLISDEPIDTIKTIVRVGDVPKIASYRRQTKAYAPSGYVGDPEVPTELQQDGDFIFDKTGVFEDSNKLTWIDANGTDADRKAPAFGARYYVTYTESIPATSNVFQPTLYLNEDTLVQDRGNFLYGISSERANFKFNAEALRWQDKRYMNHVVAYGKLAFDNGSPGVLIMQLDHTGWTDPHLPTVAELEAAYAAVIDKLQGIEHWKLFMVGCDAGSPMGSYGQARVAIPGDPADWPAAELQVRRLAQPDPVDTQIVADPVLTSKYQNVTSNVNKKLWDHALLASDPDGDWFAAERSVMCVMPKESTREDFEAEAASYVVETEEYAIRGRAVVPGVKQGTVRLADLGDLALSDSVEVSPGVFDLMPELTFSTVPACVAYAAILARAAIGEATNDLPLARITLVDDWRTNEMREFISWGVAPLKTRASTTLVTAQTSLEPRTVFGITCDPASVFTSDLAVQDLADYVRQHWRREIFSRFKNIRITAETPSAVQAASVKILEAYQAERLIAGYASVTATQDTAEPRKITISGKIKPAFALTFLDVTFNFVAAL